MSVDTAFERLREANPVTDPAALRREPIESSVFLASTQQRSMEMQTTQEQRTPAGPARPRRVATALAAAVLVIVAGLAGGFIASAGGGDEVSSAFEGRVAIVAAQAGAYSEGDVDAWLGYYTPDAELYNGVFSAARPDVRHLSRRSFAANDQWVITGLCREVAADEVACPMRQKDNFHGRAGLAVEAVYTFTFNENDTITAFRLDRGYGTAFQPYDSFDFRFLGWLDEAHPEVVIETGVQTDSPMAEDMAIAILYVDEFIEQSDDYPIEP